MQLFLGLMIPFLGTALGSACVFFIKDDDEDDWIEVIPMQGNFYTTRQFN